MMIKNAPYRFVDFRSISIQYGETGKMVNQFNSATGEYQYLNKRDSLVKINIKLTSDDLLYLHHKAADLGFWDFPANERGDTTTADKPVRYIIEFKYKTKTKKVVFDSNFGGDPKLIDANRQLIKEIDQSLETAERRLKK
ncbi:hypothetical protein [Mucilaginibacter sp. FT3.2]|uniref:hypothetical protein n=1 Tax=Mucilaginibacter sp. FT3.2 TaxID=2723090 RepID=UPI0017E87A53|nr:hypothetical protein [Mucilaginibacter sp. FT3.2]MBB6230486.1 hypothetical protein [Mucilaginibacter sp. FT3.2]